MYSILLLHEMLESDHKMRDYLQLGEYEVVENRFDEDGYMSNLQRFDLVLLQACKLETCLRICEEVRKLAQIPIVVVSDQDDEWEKIRLFQMGIDDYLVEPYWQGELMARMQAHIKRYKRLTRPFGVIKIDELEINAFSRRVLLRGEEVELRLKEFDMLLYLAQHMDEVVTKEELYEAVWRDSLADGFYNSVAVNVKKIRGKIERDIHNPRYIETVWGVGYRFRS